MKRFTIAQTLYSLVGLLLILLVLVAFLGLNTGNIANAGLKTVYYDRVLPLEQLKKIADLYAVQIVDTSHKTRNANISWETASSQVAAAVVTIHQTWADYLKTTLVPDEIRLIQDLKPLMVNADIAVQTLQTILQQRQSERLTQFTIHELYPAIDPVSTKINELVLLQLKIAQQEYLSSEHIYSTSRLRVIILIVIGILATTAVSIVLIRYVTGQLGGEPYQVRDIAYHVATGNLSVSFDCFRYPKHSIMAAIEDMVTGMRHLVQEVFAATHNIAAAATQLQRTAD